MLMQKLIGVTQQPPATTFAIKSSTNNSVSNGTLTVPYPTGGGAPANGDIILLFAMARNISGSPPTFVTPPGFSALVETSVSGGLQSAGVYIAKATGTETGSVTSFTGSGTNRGIMVLISTNNTSWTTLQSQAYNSQGTSGDPSPQTITLTTVGTLPLLAFAHAAMSATTAPVFTGVSTMAEFAFPDTNFERAYIQVYNTTPTANLTIDFNDTGTNNILQTGRFGVV